MPKRSSTQTTRRQDAKSGRASGSGEIPAKPKKPKKGSAAPRANLKLPKKDPKREQRITYDIIVDCYNSEEAVMGWYCYLEGKLQFPFTAECIAQRAISPLEVGDEVEVVGMAPEKECQCDMFVNMRRERRPLAVPLAQLKPIRQTDAQTKEAIADWHYWLAQGYSF